MPVYEYRCERGHLFDVTQRMVDDPVTVCIECEAPVQRVFHPIAVHFKGSGFYSTDYGRAGSSNNSERTGEKSSSEGGSGGSDSGAASSGEGDSGGKGSSGSDAKPAKDATAKPAASTSGAGGKSPD